MAQIFALLFGILVLAGLTNSAGSASVSNCPDTLAIVTGSNVSEVEYKAICDGAKAAIRFLSGIGVSTDRMPEIVVVSGASEHVPTDTFACYSPSADKVYIRNAFMCRSSVEKIQPFGEGFSWPLYASFVAHETSHFIVEHAFEKSGATGLVHEYVAYVTQFETMPHAMRSHILAPHEQSDVWKTDEFADVLRLMDPDRFAIEAYRHHEHQEHRGGFIRALLDGSEEFPDYGTPF